MLDQRIESDDIAVMGIAPRFDPLVVADCVDRLDGLDAVQFEVRSDEVPVQTERYALTMKIYCVRGIEATTGLDRDIVQHMEGLCLGPQAEDEMGDSRHSRHQDDSIGRPTADATPR